MYEQLNYLQTIDGSGTITKYGKFLFGVLTVIRFISYLTAILNYLLEDDSVYNRHRMLCRCAFYV